MDFEKVMKIKRNDINNGHIMWIRFALLVEKIQEKSGETPMYARLFHFVTLMRQLTSLFFLLAKRADKAAVLFVPSKFESSQENERNHFSCVCFSRKRKKKGKFVYASFPSYLHKIYRFLIIIIITTTTTLLLLLLLLRYYYLLLLLRYYYYYYYHYYSYCYYSYSIIN